MMSRLFNFINGGNKMKNIMKEILEWVFMALFLIFVFGVGAYYDTQVYNEIYGTTANTEFTTDYGNNIGA